MKIQILSDTHLEFHRDNGDSLIASLDPTDVDVLIVAGDFASIDLLAYGLGQLLDRGYPEIVYVNGNHELYGSSLKSVQRVKKDLTWPKVHWLENETCEIGGQRFVGTTLWFPDDPMNNYYRGGMADFHHISRLTDWVYDANKAAQRFLHETVLPTDVVVTHHLPTYAAISERFQGSQINRFFATEMGDFIAVSQPKLWVFGHTHDSKDFTIGDTRLVCNPFGYVGSELNPEFKDQFIVEV